MGTKDRRKRERIVREALFLDTAQMLIQRDGLLALQMSRVAEASDYAIGTLYQHFSSKEDLLVALATRNCLNRVDLFERAARWPGPSRERMVATVIADILIVRNQPEHFRLEQLVWTDVIWGAASPDARRKSLEAGAPLSQIVDSIVRDAISAGDLPSDFGLSLRAVTIGPWSLSLGMHTLTHAEGLLEAHIPDDPYRLLIKHLHYLLNGYGWRPLFDPADAQAIDALTERLCRDVFDCACPQSTPSSTDTTLIGKRQEVAAHD
ncbi:MAG: TetR/AcrR family transcriptional regulator [Lysobacteraceae bacterium]|nr:MAG: TetR/AcrR family transcriptional regulator [Xanthomonadaceae bacterium]